ncbi:MAG: hypothetical protein K6G50_08035 [bacterium]|nr:hypothetical protein [bacterium]
MSQENTGKKKLLLIDGNGLSYRSFYAVPPQRTALGMPINVILGVINVVMNAILAEKPTHIAAAFDRTSCTEHILKFQEYNVQREEMPQALAVQIPIVETLLRAWGIKTFRLKGFEADDCIGTLVKKAKEDNFEILIISGDLELMQLVEDGVKVMTTRRGIADAVIYDRDQVFRKYNLYPEQLADLRALAGDSGQNISGVPGIGEVTARKLLSQYESLDELYESLEQLPAKWRNPLAENKEDAFEFRSRAVIRRDLPLEIDWDDCKFQGMPVDVIRKVLMQFEAGEEFADVLDRMKEYADLHWNSRAPDGVLPKEAAMKALEECAASSDPIGVFWLIEGTRERGFAVSCGDAIPFYVSLTGAEAVDAEVAKGLLDKIFLDPQRLKLVYHLRDYVNVFNKNSVNVLDISTASELVFQGEWDHNLESLSCRLGVPIFAKSVLYGPRPLPYSRIPFANKLLWVTCAADSVRQVGLHLHEMLNKTGLYNIYNDIDKPLALAFAADEKTEPCCNGNVIDSMRKLVDDEMASLRAEICSNSDKDFDPEDETALGEFLFDHLGLLVPMRPKSGTPITAEILQSLISQSEIALTVQNYRELADFRRIFLDGFAANGKKDFSVEGYLFNAALMAERRLRMLGADVSRGTIAALHRMGAVIDNLINMNVRSGLRVGFEKMLSSSVPGGTLIGFKYDHFMLRLLAHFAEDPVLLADIEADVCRQKLAASVFDVPFDEITDYMKSTAVQMVVEYMGPKWMSRHLGCSLEEASAVIDRFHDKFAELYPRSRAYIKGQQEKARNRERITTLGGRGRRVYETGSRNYDIRSYAEGLAAAMNIEGSAVDIIRTVCAEIYRAMPGKCRVYAVYDDIIVDIFDGNASECKAAIIDICRNCSMGLNLPLLLGEGKDWYSARKNQKKI